MITNNKKHKEVQFHKLKTQYFNNIKKYNINKSTNEIAFIKQNMSPIKRSKRKSIRSSIINNFLHVEEQSVSGFKYINHIKIPNNICSTNHVNNTNFKDVIHLQKKHKERHQILKQDSKKSKNNTSSINIFMNNNIDKKIKNFTKIENDKHNNYNIINNNNITNRSKISKKNKNNKENKENKEEKKNNDDTQEKGKPENLAKTIKKKLFCCL